jgi:type IV pilus assembly protein PilX
MMRPNAVKPLAFASLRRARAHHQRGVVLVIALIVLVAMSLGGIAILRSVDTATLIAGNIAFKQRTIAGADFGVESAIKWISDNVNNLNNDNTSAAYFASLSREPTNRFRWEDPASWNAAKEVGSDAAGNKVHYVIHRMCTKTGLSFNHKDQLCATDASAREGGAAAAPTEGASSVAGASAYDMPPRVYVRITVRSAGPRNAVSYIQSMVLVSVPLI